MNELKPEDVMKAWECFANEKQCEGEQCAYFKLRVGFCGSDLAKDAIALLREKDAEIERLTEENERLRQSRSILAPIRGFTAEEIDQIAKEMLEVNE